MVGFGFGLEIVFEIGFVLEFEILNWCEAVRMGLRDDGRFPFVRFHRMDTFSMELDTCGCWDFRRASQGLDWTGLVWREGFEVEEVTLHSSCRSGL